MARRPTTPPVDDDFRPRQRPLRSRAQIAADAARIVEWAARSRAEAMTMFDDEEFTKAELRRIEERLFEAQARDAEDLAAHDLLDNPGGNA